MRALGLGSGMRIEEGRYSGEVEACKAERGCHGGKNFIRVEGMRKTEQRSERLWRVVRHHSRRVGAILLRAGIKFDETDGDQRAASFAFYAFFAMFPLILVIITVSATFLGKPEERTKEIMSYVGKWMPVGQVMGEVNTTIVQGLDNRASVEQTIQRVVLSGPLAGMISFAVLSWSALRFFQALVRGVNRAWGTKEYSWWRLPVKNLLMLGVLSSALFLGILLPFVLNKLGGYSWWFGDFAEHVNGLLQLARWSLPPLVLFYGLSMFFKYAPQREMRFVEVWSAALFSTIALELLQWGFLFYTQKITDFNVIYGTFGSGVALLLWIYFSGAIIIFGGCISAARHEVDRRLADQSESGRARGA